MLAKRRSLTFGTLEILRTPLLVPSFSSKGFPDVQEIVGQAAMYIADAFLVSAYDLHFRHILGPFEFASLAFLDSGGYEASRSQELSDVSGTSHFFEPWTREMHSAQISAWNSLVPTVVISYDSPDSRLCADDQIDLAKQLPPASDTLIREILLKPTDEGDYIKVDEFTERIHKLAEFQVIGVTEKELGRSVQKRMEAIAKLRISLTRAGLQTPIHVFGSLDTISTPLYFLAGADIFDGLTWLRYAYHDGNTIYRQNYGALKMSTGATTDMIDFKCWHDNYLYMKRLENEMRRFLLEGDFAAFSFNREIFRETIQTVIESVGA